MTYEHVPNQLQRKDVSPMDEVERIRRDNYLRTSVMKRRMAPLVDEAGTIYNDACGCNLIITEAVNFWDFFVNQTALEVKTSEDETNDFLWRKYQRGFFDSPFAFCLFSPLTAAAVVERKISQRTEKLRIRVPAIFATGLITAAVVYPTFTPITFARYVRQKYNLYQESLKMDGRHGYLVVRRNDRSIDEKRSRVVKLKDIDADREEIRGVFTKEQIRRIAQKTLSGIINESDMERDGLENPIVDWVSTETRRKRKYNLSDDAFLAGVACQTIPEFLLVMQPDETELDLLARWVVADLAWKQGANTRLLITDALLTYVSEEYCPETERSQWRTWNEFIITELHERLRTAYYEGVTGDNGRDKMQSLSFFKKRIRNKGGNGQDIIRELLQYHSVWFGSLDGTFNKLMEKIKKKVKKLGPATSQENLTRFLINKLTDDTLYHLGRIPPLAPY